MPLMPRRQQIMCLHCCRRHADGPGRSTLPMLPVRTGGERPLINLFQPLAVAAVAGRLPLSYFEIGSRGGLQNDMSPLAFAVDAVGFEPDAVEFERLEKQPSGSWRSLRYLPVGVAGKSGERTLFIPDDPLSASLLAHDPAIGEAFNKQHMFTLSRTVRVPVLSLADALKQSGLERIDYLKIDVEGAELEIFDGSAQVLAEVLCIKTEVAFIAARKNQPLASDVDQHLRAAGFQLLAMIEPAHWRRQGTLTDPYYAAQDVPYSKGQLIHADMLYIRDVETMAENPDKLIRQALILMSFGYFDHAMMLPQRPLVQDYLKSAFAQGPLEIVAPASRAYGRRAFLGAFYRQFRGVVPFVRYLRNLLAS